MRKTLLAIFVAIAMLGSSAFAQSGYWAGLSASLAGPSVHFGVKEVIPGFDLRANIGSSYGFGNFSVGATMLLFPDFEVSEVDAAPYLGAGFTAGLGSTFDLTLDVLAGLSFAIADLGFSDVSFFAEAGGALRWPLGASGLLIRGGVNFGF
jgi:hypothetical protein